jgi:hypothetical protein
LRINKIIGRSKDSLSEALQLRFPFQCVLFLAAFLPTDAFASTPLVIDLF